jgi:hypothetical protein
MAVVKPQLRRSLYAVTAGRPGRSRKSTLRNLDMIPCSDVVPSSEGVAPRSVEKSLAPDSRHGAYERCRKGCGPRNLQEQTHDRSA